MNSRTVRFLILAVWTTVFLCYSTLGLPDVVRIAGLFDGQDRSKEMAFQYAVDMINSYQDILPRTQLVTQIERIPSSDSFLTSKKVCRLLKSGVAAIFGPQSRDSSSHVQSMCNAFDIPLVDTTWDPNWRSNNYSINVYPSSYTLSMAYAVLVQQLEWNKFTIIYENNDGLVRLQQLLQYFPSSKFNVKVRQLDPFTDDYRPMLKGIRKAGIGYRHIVLDCSPEKIIHIFRQAKEVQMLTPYHNYVLTLLDLHTINLDEFKYSGVNITSFRLVDLHEFSTFLDHMMYRRRLPSLNKDNLYTETAVIYDAVQLFAKALQRLDVSYDVNMMPFDCNKVNKWKHGTDLIRVMKTLQLYMGMTGVVKFDRQGLRTNIHLDIIEHSHGGMQNIGYFHTETGINFTRSYVEIEKKQLENLQNQTLIVTTLMTSPYASEREGFEQLSGNDRYEGFGVDLIDGIARIANFKYIIKEVSDKQYGKFNKSSGVWNGMIGELLTGKADLAIADLTINYERQQAVDFSMPFMDLGIGILYLKYHKAVPDLFSFFYPLSPDVWIYMATAYLGMSVLLFILGRISPYQWINPYPCIEEPEELENDLTLSNCLWNIWGALMQQGTEIAPIAVSTRMLAGIWSFFTLIFISCYIANLAAFLTVSMMTSPIKNAADLAKQTKIKYGSVGSGSTYAFFRDARIEPYARMFSTMEDIEPSVFTDNNAQGIERVLKSKGDYAFLMETTSLEYAMERHCELTQIGGKLDSKGYGIAFPQGSPFTNIISSAILKLQQDGELHKLKTKWWQAGKCGVNAEKTGSGSANELGVEKVGGVFVVLMGGTGIAVLIAICEILWNSRKLAAKNHTSVCSEVWKDLKFAMRCIEPTKQVTKTSAKSKPDSGFLPQNLTHYGKLDQYGYSGTLCSDVQLETT